MDFKLKKEFMSAARAENRPVAEIIRDFMAAYVERKKKKEFETEARRQSEMIARSMDEKRSMDWIEDVADREGWS
jgi:hypothetical protein